MKTTFFFGLSLTLALVTVSASASTPDVSILNTVTQAMSVSATQNILPQALTWLGTLMGLQFVVTNYGLLKSGADIDAVIGKLIGSVLWFGICAYIINYGPDFIDSVGTQILGKYAPHIPGPGSVIIATLSLCSSILIGIAATGTSVAGIGNSSLAMTLVYILFIIFGIGMFLAIKIFMLGLELGLIVMLSPLSFSFLGLNALKDQGIAPFKALISLIYRIILMGIICSAFTEVVNVAGANLDKTSWTNPFDWAEKLNIILSMLCSFPVLAYLVYKSDSLAASLASGSTSMGTGDVAGGVAAGVAAGLAAHAATGALTSGGQKMSDVIKSMMSDGSVSNAGASGRPPDALPVGTPPAGSLNPSVPDPTPADRERALASWPSATTSAESGSGGEAGAVPTGSGSTAGISGDSGATEKKLDQLIGSMGQSKRPSFRDRMRDANQHVAQEKAQTHVSISTHHSD